MKRHNRAQTLIVGLFIMLLSGFVYAWSMISAPIAAEFPNWSSAQLGTTFTICMASFCLGGLAAGTLLRYLSARCNLCIAAALFLAGFLLASRVQSVLGLYLSYGVLCGVACGFAYNAVLSTIPRWYPQKQGLVSGALLMCFGASSMIVGSAFTAFTPDSIGAWRDSLRLMGFLIAAVLFAGSFLFQSPERAAASPAGTVSQDDTGFPLQQVIRHRSFWFFFFWAAFLSAAGLAIISQARSIASSVGTDLSPLAISVVVGLISVSNGAGRITIGAMFDRFGQKRTMSIVVILFLISAVLISLASVLSSFPVMVAGFLVLGMGYGGVPTSAAVVMRLFYGSKHYSVNFSAVNLNLLLGSFGGTVAGALYDATGRFTMTFAFLFVCILLSSVVMTGIRKPDVNRVKVDQHSI